MWNALAGMAFALILVLVGIYVCRVIELCDRRRYDQDVGVSMTRLVQGDEHFSGDHSREP